MSNKLLTIAKQYSSREEFKAKNLPKYLIAKRKGILSKAFPIVVPPVKPLKGVYYLLQGKAVNYIGYSTTNVLKAIANHAEGTIPFNNYKVYKIYSDSNTAVMALYLANKIKPFYNTNIQKNDLTVQISNAPKVLGTPIRGTL